LSADREKFTGIGAAFVKAYIIIPRTDEFYVLSYELANVDM